ncbi:MAG TPA: sigma-70 family RNA polymerase sigma factor [Planctomycetaceae bacterium]|nr:sigma-70 family RNA polymerase sigma factor [Planctomycetaceae bacterium]
MDSNSTEPTPTTSGSDLDESHSGSSQRVWLNRISTRWTAVNNPTLFVKRYGRAIRKYVATLIHDPHDAEEVEQEFMLRMVQKGFHSADSNKGKFRYYLITIVRNAAMQWLCRRNQVPLSIEGMEQLPVSEASQLEWTSDWRKCILKAAWKSLDKYQKRTTNNLFCTVLRVAAQYPDEDSPTLAKRVSEMSGQELKPEAFRKQLSRARKRFADLIVQEVARTLVEPTLEGIKDELNCLDLMKYVEGYLSE